MAITRAAKTTTSTKKPSLMSRLKTGPKTRSTTTTSTKHSSNPLTGSHTTTTTKKHVGATHTTHPTGTTTATPHHTTTTPRHTTGTAGRSTVATTHRRKPSMGDKVSGAVMKLKGSLTKKPGLKAAGTRRMHGTDGKGEHYRRA